MVHGSNSVNADEQRDAFFTADLTTTTNIHVNRFGTATAANLAWQVVEWNAAVAASFALPNRRRFASHLAA